jgi:hypothetical protein
MKGPGILVCPRLRWLMPDTRQGRPATAPSAGPSRCPDRQLRPGTPEPKPKRGDDGGRSVRYPGIPLAGDRPDWEERQEGQ